MHLLTYVFETSLTFSEPVSDHSFVLRCLPRSINTQTVMDSQVFTSPRAVLNEQRDGFGNRIVVGYLPEEHDTFNFYTTGQVMVAVDMAGSTPCHPMFLHPSRLVHWTDEMVAFAQKATAGIPDTDVCGRAQAVCAAVHERFAYVPGTTSTATTALEAFSGEEGVCQDYAQVMIALCRSIGIPARYVTGLMVGHGATHAWVDVHDKTRWVGFDPTNNKLVDDCYMDFATGRDFEDCPIECGIFRGGATQTQTVSATLGDTTSNNDSSQLISF